jgi:hypothetical protein
MSRMPPFPAPSEWIVKRWEGVGHAADRPPLTGAASPRSRRGPFLRLNELARDVNRGCLNRRAEESSRYGRQPVAPVHWRSRG